MGSRSNKETDGSRTPQKGESAGPAPKKPQPEDLGSGMASKAGKDLKGRKSKLDQAIDDMS